ncbi:hypothetical protein EMIT0111MI5_130029 [Burkholderia sp. IT-111MI5]
MRMPEIARIARSEGRRLASQTSDERRRYAGDFGHSRDMNFLIWGCHENGRSPRCAPCEYVQYSRRRAPRERPFSWQRMRVPYANRP